jgi:hypothetical protein
VVTTFDNATAPADKASKKSLIITEEEYDEGFPPRAPFVGVVLDWDVKVQTFENDGKSREVRSLVLVIESKTSDDMNLPDGRLINSVKMSNREQSVYAIWRKQATDALKLALGKSDYKFDPDDLVGRAMLLGEADRKKFKFGEFMPKRHVLMVLGPAPEGWERQVPADLAEKRQKAMERLAQNARANQGTDNSSVAPVDLGAGTIGAGSAGSAPQALDLGEHESTILAFLDGRKQSDLYGTINKELMAVPEEIRRGLFAGAVQQQLQAAGKITYAAGTYTRA